MKMANINDKKSVMEIYTLKDHKEYLREIRGLKNNDAGISDPYYPMICMPKIADEDGDFYFCHGSFSGRTGDYDSDIYMPVDGNYESMIDYILNVARTGNY
ncbi:hypothetical protein [Photobacterium leiognathi]|uniref:hypothetical protein n=1 Tax=Photobacterium leiognathi TaxID=553611 RepID=UPI0029816206|nr:hypothetical protein [Photobacterium leiognathi]